MGPVSDISTVLHLILKPPHSNPGSGRRNVAKAPEPLVIVDKILALS